MHPAQWPKSGEWTMDMDGRGEGGREDCTDVNGTMDINSKADINSKTDINCKEERREERLNKWLSQMGVCSRREADRLIEAGKVWVDGCPAAMGQKLKPGQKVVCGGVPVNAGSGAGSQKPRPVLLVVNKPRGIVCTTSDKDRAMNIVEYLDYPERIYPVGRLDKDSEGLLLMTNQGDLVNKIMRSGNAHEKEYIVTVDCPLTDDAMDRMAKGIYLKELDTVTRPCKVKRVDGKTCSIILTQGLNRQIRRMCEACGCHVKRLVRVRIIDRKSVV